MYNMKKYCLHFSCLSKKKKSNFIITIRDPRSYGDRILFELAIHGRNKR